MKKNLLTVFLLSAIVFGVFSQNGVIRELSGEVEIKPAGSSSFAAAKTGDEIARDTIVSTGFKSVAVIVVGSSIITVRPLTRLSLAEIQNASGTENINVNLQTGRVKVDVKPPAGTRANFTIQSPSAVASVRGTSFEFDAVKLNVSEGTVFFSGILGEPITIVKAGESSFIETSGNAISPAEISSADLQPPALVSIDTAVKTPSPSSTGEIVITPMY